MARKRIGAGVGLFVACLGHLACAGPRVDSVLVVVIDTLRADGLGIMGYSRPTSPEIDAFARRARVYENAYSSSPWTLPSFGTLFTGEWPAHHGAGRGPRDRKDWSGFSRLDPKIPTLAELLTEAGWDTGAIVNNSFLDARFGVSRGFATWDYRATSRSSYRRADRAVDKALEWLALRRERRFFLVVHLFDPHLPYRAPEPFLDRWGGAAAGEEVGRPIHVIRQRLAADEGVGVATLRAAHDEEVRFTDAQVGRLLRGLDELGLERRTAVLLTSDHGEEFQDHGGFEHGHTLFDELLKVPLVLAVPGQAPARVTEPVSLVDVAPTVLELLGLPARETGPGVSLLQPRPVGERTLVAEELLYSPPWRAAIRWPWKLVALGQKARLFRLDRDPGEARDVAVEHPHLVAELMEALAASERSDADREAVTLDDEAVEKLRSLGYVQ